MKNNDQQEKPKLDLSRLAVSIRTPMGRNVRKRSPMQHVQSFGRALRQPVEVNILDFTHEKAKRQES